MSQALPIIDSIHDQVVAQLTDLLGEAPIPMDPEGNESKSRGHRFTVQTSDFQAHTLPHNDRSACVNVNVRIGRVYSGFARALRWLSHNRAGNTLAIASCGMSWQERDLWVSCNRITTPRDSDGIRLMLEDIIHEVDKIEAGLARWSPQLLTGANLGSVLYDDEVEEIHHHIIASPQDYLRWVREEPAAAMDFNGLGTASIFGWLQRWEESNEWLNECQRSIPDYDKTPEWQQTYWHLRCRSLRETKRFSELLAAADSLQDILGPDHDGILPVSVRICALAGLGRYEELLRRVHSSYYDSVSVVWFWRMVAHAKLGHAEKCMECFEQYESFVGPDLYATQFLAHELQDKLPQSEPEQDDER